MRALSPRVHFCSVQSFLFHGHHSAHLRFSFLSYKKAHAAVWLFLDFPDTRKGQRIFLASGMGSDGVTVTKLPQLLMILEMYLELSYFLSQIFTLVTVTEVTKVPMFLIGK